MADTHGEQWPRPADLVEAMKASAPMVGEIVHWAAPAGHPFAGECLAAIIVRVQDEQDWPPLQDPNDGGFVDLYVLASPPPAEIRAAKLVMANGQPRAPQFLQQFTGMVVRAPDMTRPDESPGAWHRIH